MARQSTTPVQFNRTSRPDTNTLMSSARAGVVNCAGYFPLYPGDSCSGKVGIDVDLAEMPRPLLNSVICNFQAWFVPKQCHPQFSGYDEYLAAFQGETIKTLGAADRDPPELFTVVDDAPTVATLAQSEFFRTLGIHIPAGTTVHTDLVDAFWLVYNFRLAAHSSKLERAEYYSEDPVAALKFPRAFWPTGRHSHIVSDYERALVVGALDLDVAAGRIPVSGLGFTTSTTAASGLNNGTYNDSAGDQETYAKAIKADGSTYVKNVDGHPALFAEMVGETVGITLADIDKAREAQAFAKLRAAYAGNDTTGFNNDDAIVAHLMQGLSVPDDQFKRPWLLDSSRVPFGMVERHATDAGNLDQSVSKGRASATLSLNVPRTDMEGVVIFTIEVLPERLDEAGTDEWLHMTSADDYPNALRDVQRVEPVDLVSARRIDARHTNPDALYGYEPMNSVHKRQSTRLGGVYFQDDAANPWTEQRSAIWQANVVDPLYARDHFLAPAEFPHDVFAFEEDPAFEFVCRHAVQIVGLTQFGDVLHEANDDYEAVRDELANA